MTTMTTFAVPRRAYGRASARADGAVNGAPALILRLEAAMALALSVAAYARVGEGWPLFAVLFLVPDLSMLGYLAGRRLGAAGYNAAHSYLVPALVCAGSLWFGQAMLTAVGLIWIAHVAFDRLLGYGLKYAMAFGHTHLGAKGSA